MNAYGMDMTFYPTVWEVEQAKKVFSEYIQNHAYETQYPAESALHNSPEIIIKCALAKVWIAGRRYQMKQMEG